VTRDPSGWFLTLDGLDGAGKSTQARLLVQWLRDQGREVVACSDPGGTEIGALLRGLLLDQRRHMTLACEAFLFMASRAQLVAEIIRPALQAGKTVVCDRFLLANVVYQGHAGGLDPEHIWSMGKLATGGLEPDLTLILDLPVDLAMKRLQGSRDRFESRALTFHEKVRAGFRREADRLPERIRIIDACGPADEVQEKIRQAVTERWVSRDP